MDHDEKVSFMKTKKSKAAMRQFLRQGMVKSPTSDSMSPIKVATTRPTSNIVSREQMYQ
jgi:hypothetical protein